MVDFVLKVLGKLGLQQLLSSTFCEPDSENIEIKRLEKNTKIKDSTRRLGPHFFSHCAQENEY